MFSCRLDDFREAIEEAVSVDNVPLDTKSKIFSTPGYTWIEEAAASSPDQDSQSHIMVFILPFCVMCGYYLLVEAFMSSEFSIFHLDTCV